MWPSSSVIRGLSLSSLGLLDFGTPLIRVIALTHILGLREFGFASALAATYATYEQVTDISIHRFVFATPRDQFDQALASAHALSVSRGLIVGGIAVALAPLIAAALSLQAEWISFAGLALIIFVKSWEHQGLRVAERDYRYGRQAVASLFSNAAGLCALAAVAVIWRSHVAVLAGLLVQMTTSVVLTHRLADSPYRLDFASPHFKKAWKFGYPLMFNGIGLAISSQGDRLIVGVLLGLPALAIYSVLLLVAYVPISIILKTLGTITLAALHNANAARDKYEARLCLYATAMPLLAGLYSVGLLAFANVVISVVFGVKFVVSDMAVILLALSSFFKIARTEPFTALFMQEMRTRTLAAANMIAISGLVASVVITLFFKTFESPLVGKTLGEGLGLVVSLGLGGAAFRPALSRSLAAVTLGLVTILIPSALTIAVFPIQSPGARLLLAAACCVPLFVMATRQAPTLFSASYRLPASTPTEQNNRSK